MRPIDADAMDVEKIYCYYSDHCRSEDVQEWVDEQPTLGLEPVRWIPVAEMLPCEDGEYITMTDARGRCQGVLAQEWETVTVRGKTKSRWVWDGRISPWNVTHWMPLPKPPKGVE